MTAAIPLTEGEQAAIEDGQAAIDNLLGKLADTPTPAGPTPRQLAGPGAGRLLPVIGVRHGRTGQNRTNLFHRMIRLTFPSTTPELHVMVRPLSTAS